MSYPTRLIQAAAIAVIGVVALGLVLVTSALAEENIPPTAVDDAAATVQDTPVTIDVLANDSDSDGGTLSVAPGALARAAIVAANPVLFWECYPAGGGTVVDRSGNGNDGTINGATTAGDLDGDCDGDNAFLFPSGNGASVSANVPAVPVGSAPRTFIVRFQADLELAGGVGIFGTGTDAVNFGQFSVSRDWDNSRLIFTIFGGDVTLPLPGGSNLGDGNEHTIAVVYDGATTVTAYLDGVAGTPTTVTTLDTQGTAVTLGSVPWTDSNAGDQLRQFAIFDTALDATTIAGIHSAIDSASTGQAFSDPPNGTVTNNGTDVTYTPDPGFFGTDSFTYSVSDGQGGSASATVTVTVSGVAGAQPDNVNVTTGEVLTFDAVANDVIPEGLTAEITAVADPANGTAVILDPSTIEYTPDANFVGTDTFVYTLTTSPGGETSQALVTVIVTPANDNPVALDDSATTTMGNEIHIDVIANDSDPNGQSVYVSPGQLARGAILRAGPLLHWECFPEGGASTLYDTSGNGRDGTVGAGVGAGTETGDCDNGTSMTFAGSDGFIYRDSPNLPVGQEARSALVRYKANFTTEPADIPLFGYGQNGTPYAQFTVSRTILGNDKLIFTSWANDLHFDLPPGANIADGNEHNIMFVYDGNLTVYAYYDGIPSGQGTLATPLNTIDDTVMLGASPWGWRSNGDELRQFAIFPNAISEDDAYLVHAAIEAAVLNKSYTDPRFGSVVEDPDHLGFTYTPDPGYVGPDQFYYSISDGHGGGAIALVSVDVQPGVSALNDTSFTPIDTPVTINVLANDSAQENAVLTIDAVTQPAFGTVTTDGTTIEFTPQTGWLGIATFTYTVSSDLGGSDTASVSINVGGSGDNFPPIAVDDTATTQESTPVTINVLANDSDPDNDGISVSQGESAIPGINAYNPVLYWACLPAAGSSTLFDQSGNGVDGTLNGSVTPGALVDDCGGGTTMVFPNAAAYVGRTFPGLPQGSSARTVVLRYRTDISDPSTIGMFGFGTNGVGNQQFSVSRNLTGNANLSFTAWGNDTVIELPVSIADGQEHTIAIVYDGATTITGYVDGVAGTPATLFAPLDTVDSEVVLGKTLWGAVGDAAEMRHFAVFNSALSGTDIADIHNIIESVVHDPAFTQGANGTVTQTSFDSLQYTPNPGFAGTDTFTYTVADGNGGESTATVTVTVEDDLSNNPGARDDVVTVYSGIPTDIDVLANDLAPEGGAFAIESVTTPTNGGAANTAAMVTYQSAIGYLGPDTFDYTVSDGLGGFSTATVTVNVIEAPNQAPTANDDTATTPLNTGIQIDVLANDSDPDGDPLFLATPTTAISTLNSFSPSLYWSCLPESGNIVPDESGNGNDGTIQGNVVAGDIAGDCGGATPVFADGSALIFNSSPGSVPVGSSARTIVVRFRSDLATPSDVGLFGYGTNATALGQLSIARTSGGNDKLLYATWGGDGVLQLPPGSNIGDGFEHTIAIVYDGATTIQAYYDGVPGASATIPTLNTVNGQVMLGQTLYGAVSAGAEMRHFAIYPTALSGGAIEDIHTAIQTGGTSAYSQPANGSVTQVGDQLFYVPNEGFHGDDTFTYSITDGNGGEDSALVTVTVLGNQPPVANDDTVTTDQGQNITIDVLANDSDPEGDTLSFVPTVNAISTLNGMTPALYWACLPESGPTVTDQSGNGNDGTIQGNVVAGGIAGDCGGATPVFADGSALIFNGLPNTLPLGAAARTIVVRYRTSLSTPSDVGLYGYGTNASPLGQFSIARTAAGNDRLLFASWGGDNILHLAPGTNIADGAEHTIVITYDGANTVTGWVDGVAGTPATIPQLNTQNSVAMLGQTLYGAVSAGAEMRHFAIYNGVLTGTQIGEIHSAIEAGGATAWSQPANGVVTQAGNGLQYDPNVGFVGTDSFTYTIQDVDGHTASATVTVTVNAVTLAPEDDTALTQQDTPVTISVLDNDAGADLSVASATNGANGTVTTDGTTVTYTPAPGFYGTDTFTVDVTDGLATETSTVTVTVNGLPTGPNQTVETEAETPITVNIVPPVTDPEDEALTIVSAGPAANGTVTIDGADVVYTPAPAFGGTDSFDVTIEDPNGGSVTVTITVIVNDNAAPIAVDDVATTNSPLPVTIDVLANDSDPDLDPIQFASAVTQINSYDPSLYWACLPESGNTVPDESGNGNDGTIQGNVLPGDIAGDCGGATPVFADGSALIFNSAPGTLPTGNAARTVIVRFRSDLAAPSDVGLFGYGTNATALGQFSVVRTSSGNDRLWFETWGMGTLLMLPPGSNIGDGNEHTLAITYDGGTTIQAWYDGVAGAPATLFAPLNTVNGQVMLGQTLYGAVSAGAEMRHFAIYDGVLTGSNIAAIDSAIDAGGSLSYTQGANGTVTRDGDQLVYTPNGAFIGSDSFTYTISDGQDTATATVTVEVLPPLLDAIDDSAFTQQDTPVTVDVLGNDEGDNLEVTATTDGANGTVTTNGTTVTYTPAPGFYGTDTFTVDVTDGITTDTATVTVTVNGTPTGPDLNDETSPETPVTITVVPPVTDPENTTLTITAAGPAGNGTVSISGNDVVYTPGAGFIGTDTFPVTVEDADGGSVTITVTVVVSTPLVANDDTAFTQQDTPVTVDVLDNDEGDSLVVAGVSNGANGTVTNNGGVDVTYTPNIGFWGTDTFTVVIEDDNETTSSTVTVTVNGAPAGPDLNDETLPETPITVTVIPPVSDPESGALTITSAGPASNGSVTIDGETVVYTPGAGFVGTDTFPVSVADPDGGSTSISVTIVVNTPLVATDDTAFTQQDAAVTVDVLDNDQGDTLVVAGVSNGANGTVTNNGGVDVTYTPDIGFWGTDTFTVIVQDGGESTTSTVTVTVNGAPFGPNLDDETTPETPITVTVIPPVSDPEDGALTITAAGPASNGSVAISGSDVVYTPGAGFYGTDSFPVTIDDPDGGSTTITVTILVNTVLVANDDTALTQQDTAVLVDVLGNDEGDAPVVAGISQGANGTVVNNGGANVTYTPNAGFWGTDTFTVVIQDAGGESATSTVTVTVNGTPVGPDIDEETLPNTAVTTTVIPPVTDPEGGALTITGTSTPANGFVTVDGNDVTYTPLPAFVGIDTYTVTVADPDGGSTTITVTVTVNTPLVVNNDVASTQQDTPVTVIVLANDSGDDIEVDSVTDGANGTVTTNGASVTYTPAPGFWGTDTFTVTVVDNLVGGETATSTVTVTVNGAPVGDDQETETFVDTPVTVSIVPPVTDPESGPLTITAAGPAGNGTVTISGGDVVYTPASGFVGTDTFEVTIEDEDGGSLTITVTVVVSIPLVANDDTAFTQQDTPVTVSVLDNDEGDDLEVGSATDGANGTVTTDGTTVTYTPNAGFFGTDTFTVTVIDGDETATSTVTVTVNGAPVGDDIDDTTLPETPVTISIVPPVTDPESGPLTITSAGPAGNGTVTIDDGDVVYTPAPGFVGIDTFEVTIEDEDGGSVTITVTVTVDTPLVANDDTAFTQQDTPVSVAVLDNDEGDDLSVDGVTDGANGTVTTDGTTVTYTPAPGFFGTDTFTVTVVDSLVGGETQTSTVTVTVNGAPTGPDIDDETTPETPVSISIVPPVTDPEGGELTITSAGPAGNGTVTIDGDNVIYTPEPGFTGTDTFEVTIEDEDGGTTTITVTVLVHVALVANDDAAFTQQDTPVTVSVLDNDEGDVLSVIGTGTAANGTVTTDGTTVTYTPNAGFFGTDTFTVTIEDAIGGEPTATSTVTVTVNGAPTGPDIDAGVIQVDTPVTVTVIPPVTDPEGGPLTITAAGPAGNGTVTIDGDTVTYTPAPGYTGPDTFEVTIEDEDGGSVTITVTVYVNAPPAATNVELSTQQDEGVGYDTGSSVTDPNGDDVEITNISTPANGTATNVGSSITYVPNPGFSGTDTFEVTVEDEYGATATFTVTVTVNGWPEGDDVTVETSEDVSIDIDLLDGVTDPDGDDLEVTGTTTPSNGTVSVLNGVATYTPASGFTGTDSFDVTVEDGNGGSVTFTVTVNVTGAPRIVLASQACVAVVAQGGESGYLNNFWLEAPGTPSFLGISDASATGTEVVLGTYPAGTEIVLSIHVADTGHVFQSGAGYNNPDGLVHVQLTPGTGDVLYNVGFEDRLNGGDLDYNDALLDVVAVDCSVTAADDVAETEEDNAVDIAVLDNDSTANGELSITDVTAPGNGTVTELNGVLTYTPNAGFSGTDTFTYTVENEFGGSDTATVTVTVLAAPRVVLANNACLIAEVQQHGVVSYTNQFWLESPGTPQSLGINNFQVGEQADLGYFEAGTELVLSIHVTNTGHVFQTGPAYNNPDNFVHVIVTPGTGNVLYTVAWEDLFNGGDQDYNDAILNLIEVPCDVAAEDDTAFTQQDSPVTVDVLDNDSGVSLEVTSVTQGANGSVTTDGTTATYTPDAGFHGTDTFTYTASNGLGSPDTATVTVTVNGNPQGDDIEDTTAPETPVTISIVPPVTDPEGTDLTITAAGPAGNGTVTVDGDSVVYTPNPGFIGIDTFEVTIEDEDGGSLTITVTVDVNTPLVAEDDTAFTQQETPVTVSVLDNDTGDAPAVDSVTNGANGTATTDGTTVTYTPNAGFFGTDTVTVTVVDGSETTTSTLTVTVNGAPTGPDINAGVTQIDTPISATVIPPVTDPEGGPLTITSAGPAGNGTVTIVGNDVVYTPAPGYTGPDSFPVTIEDEDGGSLTITVTVFVNAPPTATDVELSTTEGVGVGFATGSVIIEPDGDDVTIVDLGSPANGTVSTDGSSITYLPNPGFHGTDSFLVTIEDSYGAQATFTVTVDVNGAPQGDDINLTTDEDVAVDVDVLAGITDPENDDLTVANVGTPSNGTVALVGSVVTYTPASGFHGTDSFEVTVADEAGNEVTITVTVTVVPAPRVILPNDACVAVVAQGGNAGYTDQFWLVSPGTPTFLGIDNRSAVGTEVPLGTFTAGTELVLGIFVTNTGQGFNTGPAWWNVDNTVHATVTPGTGDVIYTVAFEDLLNGGDLDYNDAVLDVVAIDCGVTAVDDAAETQQEAPVDIAVLDNDSTENGTLAITGTSTPANGSVTEANGVLTYTPNTGFSGTDTFTYTVENGLGGSATATVTVQVEAAGRIILSADACIAVRVEQHGVVTYTNQVWLEAPGTPTYLGIDNWDVGDQVVLGNYTAGTELVLSIHVTNTGHVFKTGPAAVNPDNFMHAIVTPGTGNVLYNVAFEDLYNGGDQDFNDAIVSVLAINCDLVANDDQAQTDRNDNVYIDVLGNDSSSAGGLRIIDVSRPEHGDADIKWNGSRIEYDPDRWFQGLDTFTYTVQDASGQTAVATVTVQVGDVNHAPEANDDTASTDRNEDVYIYVLSNDTDPDNDDLEIQSVSSIPSSQGEVSIRSGYKLKFEPAYGFTGTVTFTYTVVDEHGATDTATVTVTVNGGSQVSQGKMTGGGNYQTGGGNNKKIYNWGFELRCSTGGGHFNFHDEYNRLHINNFVFDSMTCTDEPGYDNGKNFDTVTFTGHDNNAQWGNGNVAVTIEVILTDQGNDGKDDTITIVVRRASNGQVITQLNNVELKGGNHVAHNTD